MKLHANAKLSPQGRRLLVDRIEQENWKPLAAARAAGVSERTAFKWLKRWREEGEGGLLDRSSAPHVVANRTPDLRIEAIAALRRVRMTGDEISELLDMALTTVSGILTRIGLGKLGRLGLEPAQRYERAVAGELIHIDVKKLGRIQGGAGHRVHGLRRLQRPKTATNAAGQVENQTGWECVHIAIDDASRLAYAEVHRDEKASTAIGFLRRAVTFFESYGMTVQELMTDNGPAYRATIHAIACRTLGIRHLRTRPYRPQTNGKAERFIRTMLGGWAYGAIYASSAERIAALDGWLYRYNHHRRHSAIGRQPPATRLNNLLGSYT